MTWRCRSVSWGGKTRMTCVPANTVTRSAKLNRRRMCSVVGRRQARDRPGLVLRPAERRQEHAGQNRDDGDDHQQLNQGESRNSPARKRNGGFHVGIESNQTGRLDHQTRTNSPTQPRGEDTHCTRCIHKLSVNGLDYPMERV